MLYHGSNEVLGCQIRGPTQGSIGTPDSLGKATGQQKEPLGDKEIFGVKEFVESWRPSFLPEQHGVDGSLSLKPELLEPKLITTHHTLGLLAASGAPVSKAGAAPERKAGSDMKGRFWRIPHRRVLLNGVCI